MDLTALLIGQTFIKVPKHWFLTHSPEREFDEVWPGGRTNHYWFDLNRDWMLVQHPESQGRVAKYQEWKPNVLTDHHEMGTNSTFFFQPGIPSRTHPLTPQSNQDLTGSIAEYHADALDQIQSLYYSKESFDDYYYGKGSTYPDVQGSIGILFEQASSRGACARKRARGSSFSFYHSKSGNSLLLHLKSFCGSSKRVIRAYASIL